MIKLVYFDFNFWRFDILRLSLGYSKIPYTCERVKRQDWPKVKQNFPFGQLPIMILENKKYAHTHSLARFCALKANLYESDNLKALIIDQVIDWSNEITNKIAPSIRAAMREKNHEKSKILRKEFINNDLFVWFSYLEELFDKCSSDKVFFNDKFSIADITAWRMIQWFSSGKLEQVDQNFIKKFTLLENFFSKMNQYEPFIKLEEYKEVIS